MRKLLYYIPGPQKTRIAPEDLEAAGVADSIGGCRYAYGYILRNGPDGGAGHVVSALYPREDTLAPWVEGKRLRYVAGEQTWYKGNGGTVWIGWWHDAKPGPADLARGDLSGHKVRLLDGADWLVPPVRLASGATGLPTAIMLGGDGELVEEPIPDYADLDAGAERVWDLLNQRVEGIPYTDMIRIAARALSLNYHVSVWECSALRLFSTVNVLQLGRAICDVPTLEKLVAEMEEAQKKTVLPAADDGVSIDCGVVDDSPTTDPPTPISGSTPNPEDSGHG